MQDSYKINLESKLNYTIESGSDLSELLSTKTFENKELALVIIDENVALLHGKYINSSIHSLFEKTETYIVPAGETSKSVQVWADIVTFALQAGVRRNTPVFAIGGGVTGDLAGFAAASVMRGLPLYHIPTTLLAMVDSAIGGKTGVNHPTGKNLIGAFYQPESVLIDQTFLSTLPEREWRCGLGEVLKYAAISDQQIFDEVSRLFTSAVPNIDDDLMALIMKCARIKSDIVMADEKEGGVRKFLNFGHTFAHALEAYTKFEHYAHGEAVFIGMVAALHASEEYGYSVSAERLLAFNYLYNFLPANYNIDMDKLVTFMFGDKKNTGKNINLVLIKNWEQPVVVSQNNLDKLKASFKYAFSKLSIS